MRTYAGLNLIGLKEAGGWESLSLSNATSTLSRTNRPRRLTAYDAESGKQLWSSGKTLSDWVHLSEPVVTAGKIFVATHDGHVVVFGLKK